MNTLGRNFPKGPSASASDKLVQAYGRVFGGNSSKDDAEIVLTDLVAYSGYLNISLPGDTSTELLWFNEGRRAMAGRILSMLSLPPEALRQLAEAVRQEQAVFANNEG